MSPHQTIAVAVRLFAVWLTIYVGSVLMSFLSKPSGVETQLAVWITLAALFIAALVILGLWFFPLTIARKLIAAPAVPSAEVLKPDTWLHLGCVLIGLWSLSFALPSLLFDCIAIYTYGPEYGSSAPGRARVIYHLVEVGFAAWLILGATGFRRIVWWARNAGINKTL